LYRRQDDKRKISSEREVGLFGSPRRPQTPQRESRVNAEAREARYIDLSHGREEDRRAEEIARRREARRRSVYGDRDDMRHMSPERRIKHSGSFSGKPQHQYITEKNRRARMEEMAGRPVREPIIQQEELKKERTLGKVALSIGLGVLLVAAITYCIIAFIRAENIYTDGNVNVSSAKVIELSGIEKGDHIFTIDRGEAKVGIETDPYLMFKDVRYTFPQTITIYVEERIAAACIPLEDMYVVIDDEGVVLDIPLSEPNVPVVRGLSISQYQKGYRMRSDDSYKQVTLTDLLAAISAAELDVDIASIDLRDVNHITFTTTAGMQIVVGQNERLDDKMRWVKTVIPELEKEGITSGSLDVTVEGSAAYSPDVSEDTGAEDALPQPTKDLSLIYPDGTVVESGVPKTTPTPETDGETDGEE